MRAYHSYLKAQSKGELFSNRQSAYCAWGHSHTDRMTQTVIQGLYERCIRSQSLSIVRIEHHGTDPFDQCIHSRQTTNNWNNFPSADAPSQKHEKMGTVHKPSPKLNQWMMTRQCTTINPCGLHGDFQRVAELPKLITWSRMRWVVSRKKNSLQKHQ